MRQGVIAAVLAGLLLVGCSSKSPEQAAAPTSTTSATTTSLIGQDPTKSTTMSPAKATVDKLTGSLRAHGFQVTGLKKATVEGGRMFGMTHSWDLHIDGIEGGVNVFTDTESLQGWLQMGQGLGGVFLYSTTDTWAITLDSDGPARAKSVRLVNKLGRALYDDWQGTIRTVAA
jgi:hypothetical protein